MESNLTEVTRGVLLSGMVKPNLHSNSETLDKECLDTIGTAVDQFTVQPTEAFQSYFEIVN